MKNAKRIFTLIILTCLAIGALAVTAFADGAVVMTVGGIKADGTLTSTESFTSFKEGWEKAVDYAVSDTWFKETGAERVVVNLHADWKADEDGDFGPNSYDGFQYDTIFVPSGAYMMINMNGHEIDRGLGDDRKNGEVICIGTRADVIINGGSNGDDIVAPGEDPGNIKMGTIKGGNSYNGAGGIHMGDDGILTLNNVHIKGNRVEDDDGAGIAAYNRSLIIMNGGSISDNELCRSDFAILNPYGGALYLSNSVAVLDRVELSNNGITGAKSTHGVVAYMDGGALEMKDCLITENGYDDAKFWHPKSLFYVTGTAGELIVSGCKFVDNGTESADITPTMIQNKEGYVSIKGSLFQNNATGDILYNDEGYLEVKDTRFKNNQARVFYGECDIGSHFTDCSFSGNVKRGAASTFYFLKGNELSFIGCAFGDSVFNDATRATFTDTKLELEDDGVDEEEEDEEIAQKLPDPEVNVDSDLESGDPLDSERVPVVGGSETVTPLGDGVGSMFGNGSLTMIIALVALIVSIAAIVVNFSNGKNKSPALASDTSESDSEG